MSWQQDRIEHDINAYGESDYLAPLDEPRLAENGMEVGPKKSETPGILGEHQGLTAGKNPCIAVRPV